MRNHRTTASKAVLALLGMLAMLLTALPATAAIDDGTGSSDNAGGIQEGSTERPKKEGEGSFKCRKRALVMAGEGPMYDDYPWCVDKKVVGDWDLTGKFKLCPVGFQVFRFYGNDANPTAAWTTSYLNQQQWCQAKDQQKGQLYTFWTTSGYDSQAKLNSTNRAQQDMNIERGVRHYGPVKEGATISPRFAEWWYGNLPGEYQPASARPFGGTGINSCVNQQNRTNPIADFLADATVSAESKKAVENALHQAYVDFTGKSGEAAAKKELGVLGFSKKNGRNIPVWDQNANCESPMKYIGVRDASMSPAARDANTKFTGVCYIPLERMAWQTERRAPNMTKYTFPTMLNKRGAGGLRYSTHYKAGSPYTAANPVGRIRGQGVTAADKKVLSAWRNKMRAWYKANTTWDINTLLDGNKNQVLPADPYKKNAAGKPVWGVQGYNHRNAVQTLLNNSRCKFGSNVTFDTVDSASSTGGDAELVYEMQNSPVMQAGGYARTQKITIGAQELRCVGDDKQCLGGAPALRRATYKVDVAMPDGYTLCSPRSKSRNCDFEVASVKLGGKSLECTVTGKNSCTIDVAHGSARPTLDVQLVFFTPTLDTDRVRVTMRDASATYDVTAGTSSLYIRLTDPATGSVVNQRVSVDSSQRVTRPVSSVDVVGTPVKLTKSGTQGPWHYDAPVIGAVARG